MMPSMMVVDRDNVEEGSQPRTLDCRNFWKAGSADFPTAVSAAPQEALKPSDFDHARVHPKFLHTNATSHKWAFGAIAELLDNAVDEICKGATFVKVDKINNLKDNSPVLLFQDDGGGMDPEDVRHCMSLGFSSKRSKTTIGQYGNGFKTSTMRLGADAIVFSRAIRGSRITQSIGLLSYTYLRRTMKDDIVVPMIDFEIHGDQVVPLFYSSQNDWDNDLKLILDWSPFSSKEELLLQFQDVGLHGTKVLIYNMWMNDDGLLELDFDDDDEDILLRDYNNNGSLSRHKEIVQSHISYTLRYSLRAYASILYLRKFSNFQIILRGKPVQQLSIVDEIKFTKVLTYKPQVGVNSEVVSVRTTIGFAKEAPVLGIFGFNVYHRNRLIMPFWKVLQDNSSRGRSVVGVLEANFIEPAHDKQDFERTPLFIRLEAKLKQIIIDYWKENCHRIGYQPMKSMQKESGKPSHDVAPKMKQKVPARLPVVGLSASMQPESLLDKTIIEVTDDYEDIPAVEHGSGTSINGLVPDSAADPSELGEECIEVDIDGLDSTFVEKMIEENIQLYGRRDELKHRETELKEMIEEMERELVKTRRNSSQLAGGESSSGGGGGGGGTGDGGGETVVMDHGRRKSSCGYCRSNGFTSICHGLWALSITADDYQELLDRGFRRSGSFLYKPDMEKMCCPSYTIRLRARDFIPCKEQVRVQKKMHRFLDGSIDIKKTGQVKDTPDSQKLLFNMAGDASCSTISALLDKPAVTCKKLLDEEEFIRNLSDKIDESIRKFISTGVFPSTMQLPNAVVKKVTERAKKKLMETSEDLLYTSNISFQIAAALRHSQSAVEDIPQLSLLPDAVQERDLAAVTPNIVAEKLAFFMEQHEELSGLITRACNGHLNFYSATKEDSPMLTSDACAKTSNGSGSSSKRSITTDDRAVVPHKKRKLEMQMKRSSFDPEEFALYRKYQIKVHGDKPEKVTEDSYRRFLVDTPIIYVPPCDVDKTVPPSGFGSFHQQYVIDGKLVAVGVVDILPRCLSSKYLFWDPDLSFLSLGKYSALQEINWVNEAHAHCPSLEYYYLGYYIHTCRKMRYKAAYRPSELLCPLRYRWVPFDIARPLLDEKSYVVLSNFVTQNDPEFPTQIPRNAIGKSGSHSVHNGLNQASCDNELIGFDYGVTDTRFNDESGSTSCSTSVAYDPQDTDISNIIIDLNGSRVKVKDLQQVFGPIDKKHFHELEMQLYRYIKAVGKMLSNRMIYSL